MTQKEIKIIRGKDGKVVAGQVTKTFRKEQTYSVHQNMKSGKSLLQEVQKLKW